MRPTVHALLRAGARCAPSRASSHSLLATVQATVSALPHAALLPALQAMWSLQFWAADVRSAATGGTPPHERGGTPVHALLLPLGSLRVAVVRSRRQRRPRRR